MNNENVDCPNKSHMGEYACANRAQCWEPCGQLGKSSQHQVKASARTLFALKRDAFTSDTAFEVYQAEIDGWRVKYENK